MKIVHLFPLLLLLYLCFLLCMLPDLSRCPLPASSTASRKLKRKDVFILSFLSLLYAVPAFTNLGDTRGIQTYAPMGGATAYVEFEEEHTLTSLLFFTGVGEGSLHFAYTVDGLNWQPLADFSQDHAQIFKWHRLSVPAVPARSLRLSGTGSLYLGELAVLSADAPSLSENGQSMAGVSPAVSKNESDGFTNSSSEASTPQILRIKASLPALTDEQSALQYEEYFTNSTYFDEIYHVRTAWEHLNKIEPYEISHPPLGKLIIALGIKLFGFSPFSWRFMGTFFGVLMLPAMYIISKKIFGGTAVPTLCTILLSSDFMHFVQTRIATIDTYAVFFILLMYGFLYAFISAAPAPGLERSPFPNRFEAASSPDPPLKAVSPPDKLPGLPALALSGFCFALGVACKWTAVYAGAGLALIWLVYWLRHRRFGFPAFIKNVLFCLVFFVFLPILVYYLSYIPYGLARQLSFPDMLFQREYANLVLDNQAFMYRYHANIVAQHPYSSRWYQWLLDIRPILYYLKDLGNGIRSSFGAFVNPLLCWGGLLSLPVLFFCALFRRDRDAAFLLISYLAQLIPWMFVDRLTFAYHYFPSTIFLVLAIGYVAKVLCLGSRHWKLCLGSIALCSVALFALFYPALSGKPISNQAASSLLSWFSTWPF